MTVVVIRHQEIMQDGTLCMLLATTPGRQRADLYIKRSRFAAVGAGSSDSICGVSLDRETAVTLATELLAWAMGQETKP